MAEIEPNKYRHNFKDLSDQRFGRLSVVGLNPLRTKYRQTRWDCICDCGNPTTVAGKHLVAGRTVSCGCYKRDNTVAIMTKHKLKHTPEYTSWRAAKNRCFQVSGKSYKDYGGRGISMCDAWRYDFLAFLRDMGKRPEGHSLERRDVDGDYEPSNCCWATRSEQAKNTRKAKHSLSDHD